MDYGGFGMFCNNLAPPLDAWPLVVVCNCPHEVGPLDLKLHRAVGNTPLAFGC